MIAKFYTEGLKQLELYYKLKSLMCLEEAQDTRHAGIYCIYKDHSCVYVGQSKNLASRLATHIKGKYGNADIITMHYIKDMGFSDFDDRDSSSRQGILDNAENHIISKLKPTENIIADFDCELKEELCPNFDEYEYNSIIDLREYEFGGIVAINHGSDETIVFSDFMSVSKYYHEDFNNLDPKTLSSMDKAFNTTCTYSYMNEV